MPEPPIPHNRMLILADGQLGVFSAKTATSLIRYRPDDVLVILDSDHAGQTAREVLGVPKPVPIVATLPEALALQPDALVIGVSPPGGRLPEQWRAVIRECLERGIDVVSTLHEFVGDDPEFRTVAERTGARITDLRRPPERYPSAHARARVTTARRVLTVGTDCNVGKMVASLEITAAARRQGLDARFVATGQTGILIAGSGVAVDRVVGDFMAGIVEEDVMAASDADLVVVEGQGCILHPAFSGVTAALVHGACPDAMILCHHVGRTVMRGQEIPIPPLPQWVELYEAVLRPVFPGGRMVGIALNTVGLSDDEARAAVDEAESDTGLPATDVIRFGAEPLVRRIMQTRWVA